MRSAARSETTPARPARPPSPAISRVRALRCGRTPRTSPAANARSSRPSSRPTSGSTAPTCSRSSCARSTASRQSRRAAGRLAGLGAAQPPRAVRQARPHDHPAAARDRSSDRARALQRARQSRQHPDPADHPTCVRVSLTPRPHRTRHAHPRRALPTTPRTTHLTHGNVTRPPKRRSTARGPCADAHRGARRHPGARRPVPT